MDERINGLLLLTLLAGRAALAGEPKGPPPRLEFSVASLQGNVLAAELPRGIEVDWEALAKKAFPGVDLDDATPEQKKKKIAANYGRCDLEPQLHFEAPLTPEIALYSFYLVTDSEVTPLRAAKLCGSVRVNVIDEFGMNLRPITEGTAYFGTLCFDKGPDAVGGMLLIGSEPMEPKVEKLGPKQNQLKASGDGESVVYSWAEPGRPPLRLDWGNEHSTRSVPQYRIDIAGRPPLLYVRWGRDPEQVPCAEITNLLELGEKLEKVLSVPICKFSALALPRPSPVKIDSR
jgi:hypothetical protein